MSTDSEFEIQFYESVLKNSPDYTDVIEILGALYTQAGELDKGFKMDKKLVKLLPENPTAHYNLACSLSLKEKKSEAIKVLTQAIELGYRDLEWMQEDPDLEGLHTHPDFDSLIESLEEMIIEAGR